jgi:hypothetical protein
MCFAQKLGVPFSLLFALARSSTSSAASRLPLQNDNDAHDSFDPILVVIPRFFFPVLLVNLVAASVLPINF